MKLNSQLVLKKTRSLKKRSNNHVKYKEHKPKVYVPLERFKTFLGFNGYDYIPSGITERPSGVVTFKKLASKPEPIILDCPPLVSRKRKKPGAVPKKSTKEDMAKLENVLPSEVLTGSFYDSNKGYYENLPFHGVQKSSEKLISVASPLNSSSRTSVTSSTNLLPQQLRFTKTGKFPEHEMSKRNHSFNGFSQSDHVAKKTECLGNRIHSANMTRYCKEYSSQTNLKNEADPFENSTFKIFTSQELSPQNISSINKSQSFVLSPSNNEPNTKVILDDIRNKYRKIRNEMESQSDSEIHKPKLSQMGHRCYSPTFYSLRCKKHSNRRTWIYKIPKQLLESSYVHKSTDITPKNTGFAEQVQSSNVNNSWKKDQDVSEKKFQQENVDALLNSRPKIIESSMKKYNYGHTPVVFSVGESKALFDSTVTSYSFLRLRTHRNCPSYKSILPRMESELLTKKYIRNTKDEHINKCRNKLYFSLENIRSESFPEQSLTDNVSCHNCNRDSSFSHSVSDESSTRPISGTSNYTQSSPQNLKNKNENSFSITRPESYKPMNFMNTQRSLCMQNINTKWNRDNQNAFYTLTIPQLRSSTSYLEPKNSASISHHSLPKYNEKHGLTEKREVLKSESFTTRTKHKKQLQIPLQKSHSFRFQASENFFKPIQNYQEEKTVKNDMSVPNESHQHNTSRGMKDSAKSHQNMQNTLNSKDRLNSSQSLRRKIDGMVYADLDMAQSDKKQLRDIPSKCKNPKRKLDTEYATLQFNDVGHEIDV